MRKIDKTNDFQKFRTIRCFGREFYDVSRQNYH